MNVNSQNYHDRFQKMLMLMTLFIIEDLVTSFRDKRYTPINPEFLSIINESNYNRFATPTQFDGYPTVITLSMFIEGMSSFSAQKMDFHLDMYFQEEWLDVRLQHNFTDPILVKDPKIFRRMWHPDVYFANARSASFQHVTDENFLVWVYPDGRVWYDARISLVSSCNMDLRKYPLDSQKCALRLLSYAYPRNLLRLRWTSRPGVQPVDRNPSITMPDMTLKRTDIGYCNGTYATGVWSCISVTFYVERERLHHVIQTYLPTALIVIISWFNFWLDIDSAPARVSLSITTLFTISTQANAVKMALPTVLYLKAVDVWMGICMAFVFSVMIEFTVCHFAKNQELPRDAERALAELAPQLLPMDSLDDERAESVAMRLLNGVGNREHDMERYSTPLDCIEGRNPSIGKLYREASVARQMATQLSLQSMKWTRKLRNMRGRKFALRIDERCRIAFPCGFLLFNGIYWTCYLWIY